LYCFHQVATVVPAPPVPLISSDNGAVTNENPIPLKVTFDREVVSFACAPWFYSCDINVTGMQ
jgi:hypothetical protein